MNSKNQTETAIEPFKEKLGLGKDTQYPEQFDPTLLQAVPRKLNRDPLGINEKSLPFHGEDIWTCYELSWLTENGMPRVAIAQITVPATTPNLIESKSFKLYLNGFNQFRPSKAQLQTQLETDLSQCAEGPVHVQLFSLEEFTELGIATPQGKCVDNACEEATSFQYDPTLLRLDGEEKCEELLYSNLLKSNCLITNQPDWGTVAIHYRGPKINQASLLQYIVSFRNHNEFHEQCVERIFQDIMALAKPELLTVEARYTRRGGLDINPWRGTSKNSIQMKRTVRQ
ncbi:MULTISPECIES: NADPH-dependent 7-cyano-7-deazaguanine reductase QueF [Gammaproteobacteria]|uniref:NADPH-dependent 7-cyano-7-deazaguanine reductase QueF n=1 Tax=Gammaproteobacteria TaxID=1236 RepID=UPI000DD05D4E|nr:MULTISPECIES: NADPH-dependent 7-cyano-7-deazaguanine reductase QueF [Gammaproteobacteria]RTE86982.1 NADPH-dependent 7-cyano-7-deazaguanine reductase QueF [Aliidiomarina sp. B3213]TCZ93228.1 NADPH-dependent 7-cyano-7-deazaguanine reductase QueF [Lysobacter sp. N42]